MCEITKNLTYLVIGAFLGALATGVVEWKLSQDENEMELRNVAQALYYDVAYIEDFLNYSLNHSSSKPGYVHVIDAHYYDDNGLFFDFKKDISKMDSETSRDLYDFYGFIMSLEDEQEILLSVTKKRLDEGNVTDYEFIHAIEIMKTLRAAVPDGIKKANKVKRDLIQKYHVNTTVFMRLRLADHSLHNRYKYTLIYLLK